MNDQHRIKKHKETRAAPRQGTIGRPSLRDDIERGLGDWGAIQLQALHPQSATQMKIRRKGKKRKKRDNALRTHPSHEAVRVARHLPHRRRPALDGRARGRRSTRRWCLGRRRRGGGRCGGIESWCGRCVVEVEHGDRFTETEKDSNLCVRQAEPSVGPRTRELLRTGSSALDV